MKKSVLTMAFLLRSSLQFSKKLHSNHGLLLKRSGVSIIGLLPKSKLGDSGSPRVQPSRCFLTTYGPCTFAWPTMALGTADNRHTFLEPRVSTDGSWLLALQSRGMGKIATAAVDNSPATLRPYLRLIRIDKPTGSWLLFWPCAWSIGLAATPGCLPDLYMLFLFGTGAIIMRGAGCIVNDMWDKDIDLQVKRTQSRPIASGQISVIDASIFLLAMLAIGDTILLQLNWQSILLGASSLGLVVTYPLTKRFSNWPQLFLGLVFNWGALLGWTAVQGAFSFIVCLPLYLGSIAWTLIYDTIYAHQDKKYDVKAGVKSTALIMGENTKKYLAGFTGIMGIGLATAGIMSDQTFPYYTAVCLAVSRTFYQIAMLKIDDPEDCWRKFVSSSQIGFIIMLGIVTGTLLKERSRLGKKPTLEISTNSKQDEMALNT